MRAMDRPLINHRGADFAEMCMQIFPKLKAVFRTESGTPLVFPSSGTGAWESSLVNTLSPEEDILAFVIGNFSREYAVTAKNLGFRPQIVEFPEGSGIPGEVVYEKLCEDTAHRYKAVLVIHNETSTGVTVDLPAVRKAMDQAAHPALLLVDTVSGLGSIDLRFDEWGIDVAVAGSQKGLLLPPGLGVLCVSRKALEAYETAKSPRHYFHWGPMMEYNRRGIFPYTPATSLLFGLDESLDMLQEEGLEEIFSRHARLAEGVRQAVQAWGLEILAQKPEEASNVLTVVLLPDGVDSDALTAHAEKNLNLALGAGLGELGGKAFRIGHLGCLNELEVLATLAGTEMGLKFAGVDLRLGSGVAACQEWFLNS